MKSNKPVGLLVIILLVISLFLGIVVISIGAGSAFPALNKVSAPLVCAGGSMEVDQSSTNPLPGQTYVSVSISCVDQQSGAREVKTMSAIIVSGIIYSVVIFIPSFIWFIRHPDSWGMVGPDGEIVGTSKAKKKS
jgi:hypothetical protein